jgi:hypothetical protein
MAVSEKKQGARFLSARKSRRSTVRKVRSNPGHALHSSGANSDDLFLKVVQNAGYQAAQQGLSEMGFIVMAEKDFVVKQFPDGRTERIASIEQIPLPETIHLD